MTVNVKMYVHIVLVVWLTCFQCTMATNMSEITTTMSSTTSVTKLTDAYDIDENITEPSTSATGLIKNIFSFLGNIVKAVSNSTTTKPHTTFSDLFQVTNSSSVGQIKETDLIPNFFSSLPLSTMAMMRELPGGISSDLIRFMTGKPMHLQNITKLFSSLATRLPSLLKEIPLNNIPKNDTGYECFKDVKTYIDDMMSGEIWALKMLDASGKPGSSIMEGNLKFWGNFDECLDVASDVTEGTGQVKGDTCSVSLSPPTQLLSLVPAAGPFGAMIVADWHLCLPSTCSGPDIKRALQEGLGKMNLTVTAVTCHQDIKAGPVKNDPAAVGAIVLIAILGTLVLLGSALDMNIRATKGQPERKPATTQLNAVKLSEICTDLKSGEPVVAETPIANGKFVASAEDVTNDNDTGLKSVDTDGDAETVPKGRQPHLDCERGKRTDNEKRRKAPVWQRLLLCFSAVSNGEKILSVKHTPGSLTCLNGIRVLSIGWVILGHCFLFFLSLADNPGAAGKLVNTFSFQIIVNATLSVDSFFVLSGLLVTYLFLRETEKAGGIKVKHMVMYYVHRYLRLTPAYAFVIFFNTCLSRYFVDGPIWTGPLDKAQCEKNWWASILYISNIYRDKEQCLGWGWYLANDMQFYVVAPLALVPFAFARKRGLGFIMKTVGVCMTVAFILTSLISTAKITFDVNGDILHNGLDYAMKVYQKPWCRIGTFAIGVGLGFILHTTKSKIHMSNFVQGLGWFLAFVAAGACGFATWDQTAPGAPEWSAGAKAAHETLFRPGWGLVLGWVILMCCTGKGGIVNWMLSWDWWQPLARLTYGVYLVHLIIMSLINMAVARSLIHYTADFVVVLFLGYVVLSYMFAFILAILVEAPLLQLEKMLLSK